MPSVEHEALISLLCDRAEVLLSLLQGRCELPEDAEVTPGPDALGAPQPPDIRADGVTVLRKDKKAVLGLLLESQGHIDEWKRFTWPYYACSLRHRIAAPVIVVVVTTNPRVAAWARQPIQLGPGTGYFTPLVIGPDDIPTMSSVEDAIARLQVAVLSVYARVATGTPTDAKQAAELALRAARLHPDAELGHVCYDLALAALPEALRKEFDVNYATYIYKDPELRAAQVKGEALGEARGEARAILAVLEARGLTVTAEQRATVEACTDIATLDRWLRAAATCSEAAAIFAQ